MAQRLPAPYFLAIFYAMTFSSPAYSANYFVSPSGDDNNNGTSAPWKTVAKVNHMAFAAGDTISFEGGQTFSGVALQPAKNVNGTATAKITFTSYGNGRATIVATSLDEGAADLSGHDHLRIHNLNFIGAWDTTMPADAGTPYGLIIGQSNDISVSEAEVRGFRGTGIHINQFARNTTLARVDVTGIGDNGIQSEWTTPSTRNVTNLLIDHCRVWNVKGRSNNTDHSGSGILLSMVDGGTVQCCEVWNNGWGYVNPGTGGPVGIWAVESSNITFQFNESHHNKNGAGNVDGGGFDFDGGCVNATAQWNYSHDNDGPGFLVCQYSGASALSNIVIRYNISENDARATTQGAVDVYNAGGTVDNARFYDNIIYGSSVTRKIVNRSGRAVTNFKFQNNIFITRGGRQLTSGVDSNFYFQGNLYWALDGHFKYDSTHTSLADWRAATGQEKNGTADSGIQADLLMDARNVHGKNVFGGGWELEITNISPIPDHSDNTYVYLLTGEEAVQWHQSGVNHLLRLPRDPPIHCRVNGIDLAMYGAKDVRALYEKEMSAHPAPAQK